MATKKTNEEVMGGAPTMNATTADGNRGIDTTVSGDASATVQEDAQPRNYSVNTYADKRLRLEFPAGTSEQDHKGLIEAVDNYFASKK